MKVKLHFIWIIAGTILLSACGYEEENNVDEQNGGQVEAGDPVGPISASEFNSVQPPTYTQFVELYEEIVGLEPDLVNDEETLTIKIFNRVKELNATNARATNISSRSFFYTVTRLTIDEWKVILLNPVDSYNAFDTVSTSSEAAELSYPCDSTIGFEDGKADAVRHAYWNALMVRWVNPDFAEQFATAHESSSASNAASKMDLHNNKFGRDFAIKFPDATDEQILEMLLQQKFTYIENMNEIPAGIEGLVYFSNKSSYDGTMTGYITNPDSGGPWDATFDMTQCDNKIRGQYTIIRGESSQNRRYSGIIDEKNSTMSLDVAYPYTFENPEGLTACAGMKMILAVNGNSLSGYWTSTNCRLGGDVNISK